MPIASAFRSALHVLGAAVIALLSPALWAQSGISAAADGFDPNVAGNVFALVVQPDGKILIGGNFLTLQPNGAPDPIARANIARLLPDGRNDAAFNGGTNGEISTMVLQPDGRIVIGGKFTMAGGKTRNHLARLNADGSLDEAFDPNITGRFASETTVSTLLLQPDGAIIAGGAFTTVQPAGTTIAVTRNRIARFKADGSLDAGFNPNANNNVLALALQADGKILVGGGFTTLQPTGQATAIERHRIARLNADGSVDTFNPTADNLVSAIAVRVDGRILIGGTFTTLQPNGAETALSTMVRMALLNADGTLASDFTGYADGQVATIKVQPDGMILVGGAFSSVGTGSKAYAARLYPTGEIDASFSPGPNFTAYAFGIQADGSVVLGGGFTTLAGTGLNTTVRNHVARVSWSGGLDADFRPDANGRVRSLALQSDGKILVGGSFTSIAGETRSGIARLDANGAVDRSFNANVGGIVLAAAPQADGYILIGGTFTRVGGFARPYFARLKPDGSIDETFNCATNAAVNAIKIQADGKVLVGGAFTQIAPLGTVEPVSRSRLARLNTDGTLDLTFYPTVADTVFSIVLQSDKKILIGGSFTSVLGTAEKSYTSRMAVARLNEDGTVDSVFDPRVNGVIYALALQSDGKVVLVGAFQQMAPNAATTITDRHNIARVNADGTLDASFDPDANNTVDAVVVQTDGKLVIGGMFTALHPAGDAISDRFYIARLETSGKVDQTFDPNPDLITGNGVVALALTSAGKTLVGGSFTRFKPNGGAPVWRSRLVQLNTNGTVDESFNSDMSTAAGAPIESITVQGDGQLVVAGAFTKINGSGSAGLAAFFPQGTPNTGFAPTINGTVYGVTQNIKGEPVETQSSGFAWLQNGGKLRPGFTFPSNLTITSLNNVAIQADGKLLISGAFTLTDAAGYETTHRLLRFNEDGSIDTTFAMKIVDLDTDNDGTLDSADSDIDGDGTANDTDTDDDGDGVDDVDEDPTVAAPVTVSAIYSILIQSDGKILIGGSFTAIDNTTRTNLARLNADGSLDTAFVCNAGGEVYVITRQADGQILIGGAFTTIQSGTDTTSNTRNYIARIDAEGKLGTTFDPNMNGLVAAIIQRADGKILVGGQFTTVRPNGATTATDRTYLALLNTDGTLDTNIDYEVNSPVSALTLQADGKILAGGYFTSILDHDRNYLARLNADGAFDDSFNPNPNGYITSIAVQADGKILVTGSFTGLQPNSHIFDTALTTPRSYAARLNTDGTIDAAFNPNFNGTVYKLVPAPDTSLIALGTFTTIQPVGSLLVGGTFTDVSGVALTNLALFARDGSISSFQPNPNGSVYAVLAMINGQVVIGGSFTTVAGVARNHLARFAAGESGDVSSLDAAFNPDVNGDVYALALQSDGKLLVGGSFTNIGGGAGANLARLNVDGTLDGSFHASVSGTVRRIVVQRDGRILFTRDTATGSNVLARLNVDGSLDTSFNPGNDGAVLAVAVQTDGHIVVGGSFTNIGGAARTRLARLNVNGTLDSTLTASPNGVVTALAIQTDGKIAIGGQFSAVDGLPRFGLARIAAPAAASRSFVLGADHTSITWLRGGGSPEVSAVLFESSTDGTEWETLGAGVRVPGTSHWRYTGFSFGDTKVSYVRALATLPAASGGSSGVAVAAGELSLIALPVMTSATVVSAATSTDFFHAVAATNYPTSFTATGLPAGLSIDPTTGFITGKPTQSGTFAVTITAANANGSTVATLTVIVSASGSTANPGRLINLSINGQVASANPIIAGFVIDGKSPQTVLLRGVGPGMSIGGVPVSEQLATPKLRLFDSTGLLLQEAGAWGGLKGVADLFARLGAFPLNTASADAAIVVTLQPGAYSLHVVADAGMAGRALAEVYDASTTPPPVNAPRLMNLSARGIVSAGETVTGGFVITGTTSKRVLVRGIGPTLANYGVTGVLSDPTLTVHSVTAGRMIAQNDNWQTPTTIDAAYPAASAADVAAAFTPAGAFSIPAGSTDAAVLITLAPGVYAAEVKGANGATGAALVEVYEVP